MPWTTETDAEFQRFLNEWAEDIYAERRTPALPKPTVPSELLLSAVVWSIVSVIVLAGSYSAYRLIVWAVDGIVNHWFHI